MPAIGRMTDCEIDCSNVELVMKGASEVPPVVPKDTSSEKPRVGSGQVPIWIVK